jgi:hypothetical protein
MYASFPCCVRCLSWRTRSDVLGLAHKRMGPSAARPRANQAGPCTFKWNLQKQQHRRTLPTRKINRRDAGVMPAIAVDLAAAGPCVRSDVNEHDSEFILALHFACLR